MHDMFVIVIRFEMWGLLDVKRRHAGEEDFGSIWINIVVNPCGPCF